MKTKTKTIAVVLLAVSVLAGATAGKQKLEQLAHPTYVAGAASVPNPAYPEMAEMGRRNGLDLSFLKVVTRGGDRDGLDRPIFKSPPNSYDAIIIGDSSISFSLSTKLLEQFAHRRVAIIGERCLIAAEKLFPLVDKIADHYLKPRGVILFSFNGSANWEFDEDGNCNAGIRRLRPLNRLSHRSDEELSRFFTGRPPVPWWRPSTLFSAASYEKYGEFSQGFAAAEPLLPQLGLYESYLEPRISPQLTARKNENLFLSAERQAFQWDGESQDIFIYMRHPKLREVFQGTGRPMPKLLNVARLRGKALLGMRHPFALVVPFDENEDQTRGLRNMYATFPFSEAPNVIDLPNRMPAKTLMKFQNLCHLANDSAVVQSVEIGKWLKTYFDALPSRSNSVARPTTTDPVDGNG